MQTPSPPEQQAAPPHPAPPAGAAPAQPPHAETTAQRPATIRIVVDDEWW